MRNVLDNNFYFINEHTFCFLNGFYICFFDIIKKKKRFLCAFLKDEVETIRYEVQPGTGAKGEVNLRIITKEEEKKKKEEAEKEEKKEEGEKSGQKEKGEINLKENMNILITDAVDEELRNLLLIKCFACNRETNSIALIINKGKISFLYFLMFDKNLDSFEIKFSRNMKWNVKSLKLVGENIYVLIKKGNQYSIRNYVKGKEKKQTKEEVVNEKEKEKEDEEEEEEVKYGMNKIHGKKYSVLIFKIPQNNTDTDILLKKISICNTFTSLKEMIICPYDETKIILLSPKSMIFCTFVIKKSSRYNENVSKEFKFSKHIIAKTWISHSVFIVAISNNQLLFFNFTTYFRYYLFFKVFNNYSKINFMFYKKGCLFISLKSKEIVCIRINYDKLLPSLFKKVSLPQKKT